MCQQTSRKVLTTIFLAQGGFSRALTQLDKEGWKPEHYEGLSHNEGTWRILMLEMKEAKWATHSIEVLYLLQHVQTKKEKKKTKDICHFSFSQLFFSPNITLTTLDLTAVLSPFLNPDTTSTPTFLWSWSSLITLGDVNNYLGQQSYFILFLRGSIKFLKHFLKVGNMTWCTCYQICKDTFIPKPLNFRGVQLTKVPLKWTGRWRSERRSGAWVALVLDGT